MLRFGKRQSLAVIADTARYLGVGAAHIRNLVVQHLPANATEAVDVRLFRVGFASKNFRGHPVGCPNFTKVALGDR
jgi:hypothetical protein